MSCLGHEAPSDCTRCPRLVAYRTDLETAYPTYRNKPVPAFGALDARLLIVGLAPGKSGANRTGRPFTGDYAGDLLYATLLKLELATGRYEARPDDGLTLHGIRITNAARCVPPDNRPLPGELKACRPFLEAELAALPDLRVIVALGRVAHQQVLSALGHRQLAHPFAHGRRHSLSPNLTFFDSYHCSRYNTNTGRLTAAMFEQVLADAKATLG